MAEADSLFVYWIPQTIHTPLVGTSRSMYRTFQLSLEAALHPDVEVLHLRFGLASGSCTSQICLKDVHFRTWPQNTAPPSLASEYCTSQLGLKVLHLLAWPQSTAPPILASKYCTSQLGLKVLHLPAWPQSTAPPILASKYCTSHLGLKVLHLLAWP